MAHLAVTNRELTADQLRQVVTEVVQRDVMGDLEYRTNWVATVIKSGPLLGLFGTVLGMMAAFGRIGTGEKVQPSQIAAEISIALVCTAMGLATAIPFNFMLASLNDAHSQLPGFAGRRPGSRARTSQDCAPNALGWRRCNPRILPSSAASRRTRCLGRKSQQETPEFDITAMVDLVFMMNMYFLVTFITVALAEINLPTASHCEPLNADDAVVLTVLGSLDGKSVTVAIGDGDDPGTRRYRPWPSCWPRSTS